MRTIGKIFFFSLLFSHYGLWAQNQKSATVIHGQYIVVLKESVGIPVIKSGLSSNRSANAPNKELRQQNLQKIKALQLRQKINESAILFNYADAIVGFSVKLSNAEVTALKKDPSVEEVYQDYEVKLDYKIVSKAGKPTYTQVEDCAITTSGGHTDGSLKFTWIWILDTGIDTDHPDLNVQKHMPFAVSFTGSPFEDVNGHGTHVAGIAAAKDNDEGVVGMSAGAKVVPVKVLSDPGTGEMSAIIAGLNHVAQYAIPGDVVNMSVGAFVPTCAVFLPALPTVMMNLANAGVWLSISAGNDGDNSTFYLPACINGTRIFTVAAVDCANNCAAFSNLGSNVDWYAVGVNVFSTYTNGSYATLSGTSMAAPVVSGIIHSRGQAPLRGSNITCQNGAITDTTMPLARRL